MHTIRHICVTSLPKLYEKIISIHSIMNKNLRCLFTALAFFWGLSVAQAQFQYNQPITVTNNENSLVLGWQVPIYINTAAEISANKMKTDGSDIRFSKDCQGTQPLYFFIDSGMNSTKTKIWVRIDTLTPLVDLVIYMRYGNSSASAASSYATFNGPYSSTDSVKPPNTNTVSDCQRSAKFSPKRDIIVSSFGKLTPDGTTRWVTLFDYNTQAKLEQIQVAGSSAQYSYTLLPKHIWLEANKDYIIALHNASGHQYYYGAAAQASPYITYADMRYCNSCNQNTFPTTVLTNNMYGVPDFHYYTVDTNNITNEPTYVLGGSGSGGNAEIELGANPHICSGNTQAILKYNGTKGNPMAYDIMWSSAAQTVGFTDVTGGTLMPNDVTINVPPSASTGIYKGTFTIINACGPGKSYPIEINVNQPINIDNGGNPTDTTVCPRDPSGFTVGALGPDLIYQWQVNNGAGWTNLTSGADYANVNSAKLLVLNSKNSFNGNQYRCMVSSSCASSISSNPAKLIVNVDPIVSTSPSDVLAKPNDNVKFKITHSGTAKYQWQVAHPGGQYANVNDGPIYNGVKTTTLSVKRVSSAQNGYQFRCLLYNAGNCIAPGDTSAAAILYVEPPQSVSSISANDVVVIYPNPATGNELFIKHNTSVKEAVTYTIIDKVGKVVAENKLDRSGTTKVNISGLAAGMYLIEISDVQSKPLNKTKFTKL